MEAASDICVYIDVGTSTVKTTHLYSDPKYLTDPELAKNGPKVFNFPEFAISRVESAETEDDVMSEIELSIVKLHKSKNPRDFEDLFTGKIRKHDRLHIVQLLYNMMNSRVNSSSSGLSCPLVLTEKLNTTTKKRSSVIEHAFESLHAPALYLASTPVLTEFSEYKDTGVVVELSESTTHVVCVREGYPLRNFLGQFPRAGIDVTNNYIEKITGSDARDTTPLMRVMANLARDGIYQKNEIRGVKQDAEFGDSSLEAAAKDVYLSENERSIVEEIQATVVDVLTKIGCEKCIFDNLVLCGGIAPVGGVDDKIISELNGKYNKTLAKLTPRKAAFKYLAPVVGARILAAVPGFRDTMATKAAYYECGADFLASRVV